MKQNKQSHRGIVMAAVFIATFMTSVEVTIVTTALPEIISALNGLAAQSWIMSAYLLTTAITTPIYGKLADSWGRRKIFQWGVIVFTIGSLFSGLARTMPILIIARAVQGIGAGAVMPLTFTIIADYYDFKERAKVLALNNSAWALSSLVGPMIGGFLVDTLSWHWVFFVNVPLGILVAILIQFGYREPKSESSNFKIDHKGISLLTIALITLLMGVQLLAKQIIIAIVLLIISVVSIYLFIRAEKMVSDPLISPKLFKNQTFFAQIATATILSGVLMGYEVYFPIWLQSLYRLSATTAGMVVTSSSVLWLISSFFVGPLLNRFIPKKISLTVVSVLIISYSILSFAGLNFPVWAFYVIAMVNGAGMGIVISMNLVLAQNSAPTEMVGSASSIVTLGRSLGQTVMTGVYGTILNLMINATRGTIPFSKINNMISSSGKTNHPTVEMAQVVLNGLHGIFISAAILLVICWFINLRDPLNKIVDK